MATSPISAKEKDTNTRELVLTLNKRLAVAVVCSGIASLVMAATVILMFPLKENIPYIVKEGANGSLYVPQQEDGEKFNPSFENQAYFLRRWITDAFVINQYTTVKELDPRARLMLRGSNAIGAYTDWLKKDGKFEMMAEDPTLVRDVDVLSITPIAGTQNGVVADVKLTKRKGGTATEERKLVTIYYDILPLKDRRDVEVNPIGIFITDFKVGVGNA